MGQSYRDLVAWQRGMDLVEQVHQVTLAFPKCETYCLGQQLRRAAISVPSNIAEGQGRFHPAEFRHALGIARGSLMEVETQLLIAERLGYAASDQVRRALETAAHVGKLINGLIGSNLRPHGEASRAL